MSRPLLVKASAFLWASVVFMPVGLNYLGGATVLVALLSAGGLSERTARWREHPLRWPLTAYVLWTLVVFALQPHYSETASNLWHGMRIAVTIAMTVVLSDDETVWALRGFLFGALLALAAMLLTHMAGLPDLLIWHNVAVMKGNKSINDALLFAVLGASAAVWGLSHLSDALGRWRCAGAAFAATVGAAAIVTVVLPSRTSLLALLAAVLAACVHQWRGQLRSLFVALCVVGIAGGGLMSQAPSAQEKFRLGVQEVETAQAGAVSEGSWVVRFYMYRETARMMLDKPWAGWGIGGWTTEWHRRAPKLLYDYNMPHNDFLWMGAQAGVPGLLTLLLILLIGMRHAWRRHDLTGRLAFVSMLILLLATSVNSAMRDAAIGLSLPWIAFLYLRLVQVPGNSWRRVWTLHRIEKT
ncbi:O-antigen ligase family protein [Variovorax paradoxus]|nr:O-antigen ligase family protein [Variovorax paradoxus]MBT2304882.1 O-antigen ligase family protein [Variovorax paradoxus]